MSLAAGTRLGSFEVLGPLGAGGMGEVYRASDTRLGREVAIKILPEIFAEDEDRLARFEREARLLASVNHPGLAAIYGIEQAGPVRYIVMELVPGETLAEQLARGPLAIPDALRLARQIAEALEAAHEKGIVHRDLKPANIKVTPEGKVKVLDLGLAKAMDSKIETGDTSQSPTMMLDQTRPGVILGTAEFMSPEQARGKAVDKRTDIWAFGCVLYEMLTGWRIFHGETISDVLAAILTVEPDWNRLPKQTPPRVRDLLVRCLKKDANERLRDIGDARLELGSSLDHEPSRLETREGLPEPKRHRWTAPLLLLVFAIVISSALYLRRLKSGAGESATSGAAGRLRSLVVLPSRDLSGAPGGQLVGDGLVETLSARLGEIPGIQVVTPTAAVAASDSLGDPFRAARSVGADLAVRSSLMRNGGTVRIAYSIWDVGKRSQLASGTVDGADTDMFGIQDRLAEGVAGGLKLKREAHLTPTPTGLDGASAQEKYLQALGNLQRYDKPAQVDAALRILEGLLVEKPNSALIPAALGRAYLYNYNLTRERAWAEKAASAVSRARQLNPDLPEVNTTLGELDSRTGKPKEAIAAFERTLAVRPNDFDALLGLARAYDLTGDSAMAEKTYRRAIALQPSLWMGYSKLGGFFFARGEYAQAAEMFFKVTQLLPDNARAFANLGAAYYGLEDLGRALVAFEQSIALEPTDLGYSNVGTVKYYLGRYSESAAAFERALEILPSHYELWANIGDTYAQLPAKRSRASSAYIKGITLARQELATNPDDPQVHSYLGLCLSKIGHRAEAEEHTARALATQPQNPEFLFNAAVVANRADKPSEAVERLAAAIRAGFPRIVIRHDPEFEKLRQRVDFENAVRRAKLTT
ncbi:MAG: protein kinase [Acidobacteriota bacterium]